MLDLAGKRILVTGASSGIGSAVSRHVAGLGANVILSGRRVEALAEVAATLDPHGDHVVSAFDLDNLDGVKDWLQSLAADARGGLSGMVHCAGVSSTVPFRTLAPAHFMDVMRTNAGTTAALLSGFLSRKVTLDGAAFVACSSIAAHTTSPGLAAYSASKQAVESLVRTGATEGRSRRLRVNAIAPGYVATPMLEAARLRSPGFETLLERQFLGTLETDEVAFACAYLLSAYCKSVTGTVFLMDGGFTL